MKKRLNVGIVGAGLIGGKRAEAIAKTKKGKLIAVADPNLAQAKTLAEKYRAESCPDWKTLIARNDIDVVAIAVPNVFTSKIVLAALKAKKHVLVEKPFGITPKESRVMLAAGKKAKKLIKVGFNLRFHPAIAKAYEIVHKGGIGKVLFIRSRYGHGGRKGMEKEWRFDKKISGGGELLDQGVHVVDLARCFGGEIKTVYSFADAKFWKTKVDDNAFAIMRNGQVTTSFHVSTTQWRNLFSFEVFGELGYVEITGRGGSYGEETLQYGKRNLGFAPTIEHFQFGTGDDSWEREWENFVGAIEGKKKLVGGPEDGLRANEIVEALYKSSQHHEEINL